MKFPVVFKNIGLTSDQLSTLDHNYKKELFKNVFV